jgi:hypothetical protein
MPKKNWTTEHTIVALQVYFTIPFNKASKANPIIIKYAQLIEKTPSSLNMKIGNFGSLDPELKSRGISGLDGATKQDKLIWNQYAHDKVKLKNDSDKIIEKLSKSQGSTPIQEFLLEFSLYLSNLGFQDGNNEWYNTIAVSCTQHIFGNPFIELVNKANLINKHKNTLDTLTKLCGFKNFKLFEAYCKNNQVYAEVLLAASKTFKSASMISTDSVFEIYDSKKVQRLIQHVLDFQDFKGGIFDLNETFDRGTNRSYLQALKKYYEYLVR